jgi:hypothetical protein
MVLTVSGAAGDLGPPAIMIGPRMHAPTVTAAAPATRLRWLARRWPSLLGAAFAAGQLAAGPDTEAIATVIAVAVLCYLAAAAFDRRWVAWAGCAAFPAVVIASWAASLAWWAVAGAAALVMVAAGWLLRVPRAPLNAQTAALLGYGALAVIALFLEPRVGLALAGAGLALHAVWDVIHYRRNRVVHRSLAELCVLLDIPLGAGAIVLAIAGVG